MGVKVNAAEVLRRESEPVPLFTKNRWRWNEVDVDVVEALLDLGIDVGRIKTTATMKDALAHCVDNVRGRSRRALLLRYSEGLELKQIAERLGWSRANVKVRAHRARKKLKHLLKEYLT